MDFWRQIYLIAPHLNSIDLQVMKFGTMNVHTDIYIHTNLHTHRIISFRENNF
jgi:hypothetical protein